MKLNSIIWYFVVAINSIFFIFISWKIFLVSLLIIIPFIFLYIWIENINSVTKIDENLKVVKKLSNGVIVKCGLTKFFVKTWENFTIDDVINIKSNEISKIKIGDNFDNYLKSEGVKYIINKAKIKLEYQEITFSKIVDDYLMDGGAYYSRYVPLILIGKRYWKNIVILDKLKNISVLHLFTISGFHISILIFLFSKILDFLKIKNKWSLLSINVVFIPYLFVMSFPIAACRAVLFSFLCSINKYFLNNKFHNLNILSTSAIFFFVINPYIIFSLSFIFTYLLMFAITIITSSSNKKYLKIKIILICWWLSSIINVIINKEIVFTSIISSLFFTPLISFSFIFSIMFFWWKSMMNNYYFLIDIIINIFQYLKISIPLEINLNTSIIICSLTYILQIAFMKKQSVDIKNFSSLTYHLMNKY